MANFRVHARVLDLLGEEQIADLPTAISELFKNAYDAYAHKAVLDIYAQAGHAVLWDDGFGMSEYDLSDRWLVVGTPSKKLAEKRPKAPEGRTPRPVMGEKGIGRLAISRLGDSLLLVTRRPVARWASHRDTTGKGDFSALFINWNITRNPHLLLEDIYVPVLNFDRLEELDQGIVATMVEAFLRSVTHPSEPSRWAGPPQARLREQIVKQCEAFTVDPLSLRRTALAKKAQGTAFFIGDLHEDIGIYANPNRFEKGRAEADSLLLLLGADRPPSGCMTNRWQFRG